MGQEFFFKDSRDPAREMLSPIGLSNSSRCPRMRKGKIRNDIGNAAFYPLFRM